MRAPIAIPLLLAACGPRAPEYPLDDVLTLNHVQVVGTHNSYHVAPEEFAGEILDYTHAPLTTQLAEYGVRQFELDVNRIDPADPFEVFHVFFFDEGTTCRLFTGCLRELKTWSDLNPLHVTLIVMLEPKDLYDPALADAYFEQLEAEVLSVWPRDRIVAPADVQGDAASLPEAISANGWPSLRTTRGKALFQVLDGAEQGDHYTHGGRDLDGRLFFARSVPADPFAGFVQFDGPLGNEDAIVAAAKAGYIIRTRADNSADGEALANDTTRLEAALASGAQFVSTDYPGPVDGIDYVVQMPGEGIARCNPVTAPPECTNADIEVPWTLGE